MSDKIAFKSGKEVEWIELNILRDYKPLSKSDIVTLSESLDESEVDGILSEMDWRGQSYHNPVYVVENNTVIPKFSWQDVPEYFLCLYYSYFGANDYSGGTKLFEQISANALQNFLEGKVYTLGFPASTGFNQALDQISRVCFEQRNMPADGSYNDDGVDVVGYKLFDDGRSSNLYVLLQCAAGKHWTSKKPIAMNRWTNYLVWYTDNIITSISTVEYVPSKDWNKRTSTYGMLFDRLRIQNYLYKNGIDNSLREVTTDWCQNKLEAGI